MDILHQTSEWLIKISTGWITIAALVIFGLFIILVLPRQAAATEIYAEEVGTPDLSFYYSPYELYHMADAYGEEGRAAYIRVRFTFDLIWPLIYTFTLVTVISWLTSRAFPPGSKWHNANLFPFIVLILDYLENFSTSLVMFRYPEETDMIASLAPFLTLFKWVSLVISLLIILIAVLQFIIKWLKRWRNSSKT